MTLQEEERGSRGVSVSSTSHYGWQGLQKPSVGLGSLKEVDKSLDGPVDFDAPMPLDQVRGCEERRQGLIDS